MPANFPRGGKRVHEDHKVDKEDDLFKTSESISKKKKIKKAVAVQKTRLNYLEYLKYQTLSEGLLVLGRVKEVQDLKVLVSLPNGLLGAVSITAVSHSYTQHLQSVAESDIDDVQDESSLKDLFDVGDGVPCRVTSIVSKGSKRFVELSADPREVNKDLPVSALKMGCLLYGAIQSIEEHGYMIDIGIPSIQAFLAKTELPQEDTQLSVGKGIWCTVCTQSSLEVVTGETRVVKITARNVLKAEVNPQMVSSVECLQPGMKITCTVEKVLPDGLFVKWSKYKGSVYRTHASKGLSQYSTGQKVKGRILYIHPMTKIISVSLLPGILSCVGDHSPPFAGLAVGDIVENAEVKFVDKARAVFFKLHGCTAMAQLHQLSDDKVNDVNKAFPHGSKHRCRVIGFHPADDVVLVTLKESIMSQKILSISDIHAGQVVEGVVEAIHTNGVVIRLGRGLTGFIPELHVGDVPLKNFSKKFSTNVKLKCLVLKVDYQSKKVILSKKKSLINSAKSIPTSFDGLKPGMQLEGFIIAVKDEGVVVGFCNNVKGWVPRAQLSTVEISHPETAFYKGQVVRCRVLSCQPEEQKLRLSLIIMGKAGIASKAAEKMADFEVGKVMEAKITKKLEKNLEVELLPVGTKALLPREHLADSSDNQTLLWQTLKAGDTISSVMLLKQTNVAIVTLKESFLSAAREELIPKSIEDLEPGQLLPAVIKNHQSYGIFVELPGGLGGLAPHKLTMEHPVADMSKVFPCGQSVVVKVIEVKEDKGRFLCSLRLCDCYHDDPKVSLEMLETYLKERDQYLSRLLDKKAKSLKVGSLVKVKVKKETRDGYICDTDFDVPAIITHLHTGERKLQIGEEVDGILLHIAVDESDACLEVSADHQLVRAVSRRSEKPHMDKARLGQSIKGQVLLIKDDFVLVFLKQHAAGTLAFVPRRQHPNDVLANTTATLAVGEETKVSIRRCAGDRVLAILASLAKEEEDHPGHNLQFGQIVSAQVQTILPCQMNVKIGQVKARVHVTEVVDKMENGVFPFSGYRKGQEVKVKVIGFRHFRSFRYLPISHPRLHKAMPECTLKPSKTESEGYSSEDESCRTRTYKTGDKVPVFVLKFENNKLWVSVSPTQNGVISVFDLSRDLGVLKHADKHFLPGHGYLATVLGLEEEGLLHLSLTGKKEVVKRNQVVTGKVTSISEQGLALRLPADFRGIVPSAEYQEDEQKLSQLSVGSFIRCLVLTCTDKEKCLLTLNLSHRCEDDLQEMEALVNVPKKSDRKRKHNSETDTETVKPAESTPVEVSGKCLSVSSGFHWQSEPTHSASANVTDSEQEAILQPVRKKKKKDDSQAGQSICEEPDHIEKKEDYEKRLLTNPNDSKLWIEYMCQQLNESKVEKARSIGNQALQTISLQEEQEKLNIWMALLNLENLYGSPEELAKTLQRALQLTDPFKLYPRVATMYSASGKLEEAEQIYKTMLRKYKQDKRVWIDFALFLFKHGRLDAARKLLQRALLSLDRRDHVATLTQFASLECKHGESERGFTMLEKIITEFPKRTDVMSVYIDMVVREGDFDRARELFERALTLKNTNFFYKKYLQFEEKHGTDETMARLRARIEDEC